MMDKLKSIFKRIVNKETMVYIFFGVMTTVVNFVTFKLFDMLFTSITQVDLVLLTNIIAWVFAVVFAYVTNKLFVFESKSWAGSVIKREIPEFVGARLVTLGIEELGILVFITWLGFDRFSLHFIITVGGKMLVKIGLAVIGVVLNYVFSKFIIFKRK